MAITWNMNFATLAQADFQDKAFMQMFMDALTERGYDMSPYSITKGFNLQDRSFWNAIQTLFDFGSGGGLWLRPDANLTGVGTTGVGSLTPSITSSRFENDLGFYNPTDGPGNPFSSPPFLPPSFLSGWPQHFSKQFSTFTASTEPNGAEFKLNEYYRKLDDGFIYQRITADVTIHDASGWQKSSHVVPGIRGSLVDTVDVYFGSTSYHANTGDYIFTSLLTGIRDAINYLVVTNTPINAASGSPTWSAQGANNDIADGGTNAVWLTAETNAEAAYAGDAGVISNNEPTATYLGTFAGGLYGAAIHRRRAQLVIPTPADGLTPTVQVYAYARAPLSGFGVFDANGDTIGNRVLALFDTQAADGAGATIISAMAGQLAQPARTADPTAGNTGRGYDASTDLSGLGISGANGLVAYRYDVAGGFVYRP